MQRRFSTIDKEGTYWELQEPITMGYLDRPVVVLSGRGQYNIPPEVFEMLALEYLSAHGYFILSKERVEEAVVREVHNSQEQR